VIYPLSPSTHFDKVNVTNDGDSIYVENDEVNIHCEDWFNLSSPSTLVGSTVNDVVLFIMVR
jgi:hypothetical protein